jgi:hypothetical protein
LLTVGVGDEAVDDIEGVGSGNEVMRAYVVSENCCFYFNHYICFLIV